MKRAKGKSDGRAAPAQSVMRNIIVMYTPMTLEMHDAIERAAHENSRTMAGQLRAIVKAWMVRRDAV